VLPRELQSAKARGIIRKGFSFQSPEPEFESELELYIEDYLIRWALNRMAGKPSRLPLSIQWAYAPVYKVAREVGKSAIFMQTTIRQLNRLHIRYPS
jgi:hypothetical protein